MEGSRDKGSPGKYCEQCSGKLGDTTVTACIIRSFKPRQINVDVQIKQVYKGVKAKDIMYMPAMIDKE